MINYDGKVFRPIANTNNGETSEKTVFVYKQTGNILTSEYSGGRITIGHLLGVVDEKGQIDMSYHQINDQGDIMTGRCQSRPEILENGKLRLHEKWHWTSGDGSEGQSIIEEI